MRLHCFFALSTLHADTDSVVVGSHAAKLCHSKIVLSAPLHPFVVLELLGKRPIQSGLHCIVLPIGSRHVDSVLLSSLLATLSRSITVCTCMQVVGMFAKAKSPLHTAAFHEATAQVDMDENRDYARAEASIQVLCCSLPPLRPAGDGIPGRLNQTML
jgi:hypothetical protein